MMNGESIKNSTDKNIAGVFLLWRGVKMKEEWLK